MGLFLIILSFCSKIQCKIRRRSVLPTCWPHSVKSTLPVRTVRFWFSYVLFFLLFFSYFPTGQKEELCLKWSQIPILFSLRHRNERRIYFIIVTLQYNSRKFLWTRKVKLSFNFFFPSSPLSTVRDTFHSEPSISSQKALTNSLSGILSQNSSFTISLSFLPKPDVNA